MRRNTFLPISNPSNSPPEQPVAMLATFWLQFKALTKKNLRLLLLRHWIATLLQAAILPVLILTLTLNINNFSPSTDAFGVGTPRPIRSIRDSIGPQILVFVRPSRLGPDVDTVIKVRQGPFLREPLFSQARANRWASSACNYRKSPSPFHPTRSSPPTARLG